MAKPMRWNAIEGPSKPMKPLSAMEECRVQIISRLENQIAKAQQSAAQHSKAQRSAAKRSKAQQIAPV
jgi:hypothetical protein